MSLESESRSVEDEIDSSEVMQTLDVHLTQFADPAQKNSEHKKMTDFELDDSVAVTTQPLSARLIGKTLGEYTVEAPIGKGGMGQVFRARHRMMDRQVALKVLPSDFAADQELVDRFFLEVKSLGKLLHPNIVTAFDAGQWDGLYYLVMELIQGQSLSQYISTNGPFSIEKSIDIVLQTAKALAYAHDRGLIHRDIKPSNLMITADGTIKVLDFGLVRISGRDDDNVADQQRRLMGTVEFMSPEQIRHASTIDFRSDLYSLGATLFYLLTGQPMFTGEPVQIAISHLNEAAPLLFEIRGDVDLRVDGMFQKLVAKDPAARFASAHDVVKFINEYDLMNRTHASGKSTVSIARELGKKLKEFPTQNFGKQSTTKRELGAVGIELGMMQSQAAGYNNKNDLVSVEFADQSSTVDNVLWSKQDKLLIGQAATEARLKEPAFAFHSLQRWLGLQRIEREFCGKTCPPEVILGAFIAHITQRSQQVVRNLTHAVVTIPSSYDQLRRIAISNACRIAGVEVLQLLDKHLAASLARIAKRNQLHASSSKVASDAGANVSGVGDPIQHQLVITLTGSTAEAAVVRVEGQRATTLATAGDWQLGLLRWQARLTDLFISDIYQQTKFAVREDLTTASRVQRLVERSIKSVFAGTTTVARIKIQNHTFEWQLNESKLLSLCQTENDAFETFIQTALERSKVDISEIDEVLLIGDSLNGKILQQRRREILDREVSEVFMNQAELAKGAALQGNFLLPPGNPDGPNAHGVMPMDIGIALRVNKQFIHEPRVLLRRDTAIPTSHSRTLRLEKSISDGLSLQFLERPRLDQSEWNRLSNVVLEKTFPQLSPHDPLQVRLRVDHSGIWSAVLTDVQHDDQKAIRQLSNYSLNEEQIQNWQEWLETIMLCNL